MVAFTIFWFSVYWYGIFYLLGFLWVYFFLWFLAQQNFLNNHPHLKELFKNWREDVLLFSLFGVLLWWRLGYVLIYDFAYYFAHPLKIFAVHEWWMAFIWWIIWVFFALLLLKKVKKLSWGDFLLMFDCILLVLPLAIALWRFGNYLNQEVYWITVSSTFLQTGIVHFFKSLNIIHIYSDIWPEYRFNTNFLAIIFEGFITFFSLVWIFIGSLKRKSFFAGKIVWRFLILYSFFRFFLEYLRQDSQSEFVYQLTKSQWFFVVFFIIGVWILIMRRKKMRFNW